VQSGFGTGYIETDVFLKQSDGSGVAAHILGLSYQYEVPPGITDVKMQWLSSTHLEVAYKGHPTVEFQAIKCDGIDISARDVSDAAANTSH
jgi:hypothetical protein